MLRNTSALPETASVPFQGMSPLASRHRVLGASRPTTAPSRALSGDEKQSPTGVQIYPSEAVERRSMAGRGIVVELVHSASRERIEFRYRGTSHLLVACEQGMRRGGETLAGSGLPSTLRDLTRKLTSVPAGCSYFEWHQLHASGHILLVYLDPAELAPAASIPLAARQSFDDAAVWSTVVKLKWLVEGPPPRTPAYLDALAAVLMHELALSNGESKTDAPARGGLAAWQQRLAASYIEEHLSEQIPLATLAGLARLSAYHFSRAFKQSFGVPPHRYHTNRRIERAKTLLEGHTLSVTEIGMTLGFSETSSFSAAFRKITGLTPSRYHRSLSQR